MTQHTVKYWEHGLIVHNNMENLIKVWRHMMVCKSEAESGLYTKGRTRFLAARVKEDEKTIRKILKAAPKDVKAWLLSSIGEG